jgi:acetate kinase
MPLLILNAGSSSLKFTLIDPATEQVSRRGTLDISAGNGDTATDSARSNSAVQALLDSFDGRILGVAHRVVHGGAVFSSPVRLTPEVCDALSKLTPMAPLHNPPSLTLIDAAMKKWPDVPHVAVFDTAFRAASTTLRQPSSAFSEAPPRC